MPPRTQFFFQQHNNTERTCQRDCSIWSLQHRKQDRQVENSTSSALLVDAQTWYVLCVLCRRRWFWGVPEINGRSLLGVRHRTFLPPTSFLLLNSPLDAQYDNPDIGAGDSRVNTCRYYHSQISQLVVIPCQPRSLSSSLLPPTPATDLNHGQLSQRLHEEGGIVARTAQC